MVVSPIVSVPPRDHHRRGCPEIWRDTSRLGKEKAAIFQQIMPEIVRYNPDRIIVVATNPVDVLTYVSWKLSNLPAQRVIGSATILDTARFRYFLSQHFRVDLHSVHAHIIGEHGDSEVPV